MWRCRDRGARWTAAGLLVFLSLLAARSADAKQGGFKSPSGRRIYTPTETFEEVVDQHSRNFVIEVVVGLAPEGNVGMTLGWLLPEVEGLELYLGTGLQANPSVQLTGTARYYGSFGDFRPYLGVGYVQQYLDELGTRNHSLHAEFGHKWRVHTTFHVTVGVGFRYLFDIVVQDGSPLASSVVDPAFLERELDEVGAIAPTFAIRLSRAF